MIDDAKATKELVKGLLTVPYKASGLMPSGRCIETGRDSFAARTLCNHIITMPWPALSAEAYPPTCPDCLRVLGREASPESHHD